LAPLRIVTPLIFTIIPGVVTNTPLLGRKLLLPSMIVFDAPPPVMVRFAVIVSSVEMNRRYTFGAGSDGKIIWSAPASALASSIAALNVQEFIGGAASQIPSPGFASTASTAGLFTVNTAACAMASVTN